MFQPFQLKTGGGIAAAVEKILLGEHAFTDPAQCFPWYGIIKAPVLPEAQHGIAELVIVVGAGQKRTLHSPFSGRESDENGVFPA